MPRFYFDVRTDHSLSEDDEGLEFPSLEAARREAACAAPSMAREELPDGAARALRIEVKDENRRPVLSVTISLQVELLAAS
jgi:hypothetical protein